jgi:hypothetical protein
VQPAVGRLTRFFVVDPRSPSGHYAAVEVAALDSSLRALAALVRGKRLIVLSGAGLSTESGIPDYRGPGSAARRGRPITYREFVGDPRARERYWARSAIGWPRVAAARPNAGHLALARLERAGAVAGVITQNVDGLHQAAGSAHVLELQSPRRSRASSRRLAPPRRAGYSRRTAGA